VRKGSGSGRFPRAALGCHGAASLTSQPLALGVAEKPGACPATAPEGLFEPCSFPCLEDWDCLGAQKCCPLGCGPACLQPLLTPALPPPDQPKPGECPVAQPGPCRERCRGDSDCPDAQKCCNSSCGRQCLPHWSPVPGVLPAPRSRDMISPHPSFHSSSAFGASDEHTRPQLRAAT
uniref:WAP domain-containing protein n=1 Tax=Strix occidentalis caurina TaxID=311401 RepID=A0A8D0G1N4_STROC